MRQPHEGPPRQIDDQKRHQGGVKSQPQLIRDRLHRLHWGGGLRSVQHSRHSPHILSLPVLRAQTPILLMVVTVPRGHERQDATPPGTPPAFSHIPPAILG